MIKITDVEVMVYRFPLDNPVQTSFGLMQDRPMVIVKLTSATGIIGWGEVWCNFPNVGAEHRARLVTSVFAPLLLSQPYHSPAAAFDFLTTSTWVLGLQTGEVGPLAQCIAGIDIALSDIHAKQQELPLWELYGGTADTVPIYASGINPTNAEQTVRAALDEGYRDIKLKIGFGHDRDVANIRALRDIVGPSGSLMVDANQAWSVDHAAEMISDLAPFDLTWLEEPIAKDRPIAEWQKLRKTATMPLAGGENLQGDDEFTAAIADNVLAVIQPDLAKWGGLSRTIPVARNIRAAGRRYCPHYLGGGIGLVASAHALAAVGGDGLLEVDFNRNPLRSALVGDMLSGKDGMARLGHKPGLGYEPDLAAVSAYQVA
ncbi:MAG: mandelate racemase/muconate lactonizing enzyme family protein [Candidatus Puniceispirillum sp.]